MVNLNTTTLVILTLLILTATGTSTSPAPAPATSSSPAPTPATAASSSPDPAPASAPATVISPGTALQFNMCSTTDYKNTCMETLRAAGITDDPRILLRTAFSAAIDGTQKAINATSALHEPKATVDYNICIELLDLSMDDVKKATKKFDEVKSNPRNRTQLLSDIRTSLSGSLTFLQTCMDEIENVTTKGDYRQILKLSRELYSNALALLQFEENIPKNRTLGMVPPPLKDNVTLITVSKDGFGMFNTINDALRSIPFPIESDDNIVKKFVINVKAGVYEEYVEITKYMKNVFLIGEGPTKTRIVGNRNVKDGYTTFRTPTLVVNGENFLARDISIENTAGVGNGEAVALRIAADKSIIYNAYIDGYQNTLYAHAHRQFYRDCTISGTVDFIFGNAAAVFQNCKILLKRPRSDQKSCVISAQSRTDWRSPTGFVFQNCTITADESYSAAKNNLTSFFGRPWKQYSRTMFMESHLDDVIDPTGWMPWNGPQEILWTIWFGEYNNRGPCVWSKKRVKWSGFHNNDITYIQAGDFVPRQFVDGDSWIPGLAIPYFPLFTPFYR